MAIIHGSSATRITDPEEFRRVWIKDYSARKLRSDLTEEQKLEAARIGRIEFKSAGATRKR